MKRFLAALCSLASLACAQAHRDNRVPTGTGPLIALYKTSIDEGRGAARGAKLAVWAERPDRLHAELIAPMGGLVYVLDAGGGTTCVIDVASATAYVGEDGPAAIEALTGVRVSVSEAVAALLYGASPAGLKVTRTGGPDGALPERLEIVDGERSLALDRVRFERGHTDPASLGTGVPPAKLKVAPLTSLAEDLAVKPRDGGDDR